MRRGAGGWELGGPLTIIGSLGRCRRASAIPPPCSLQDAYLEALDKCGGLHEARPKTLLDMLLPRFPYLTLQVNMHRSMTGGALRIGARVEHRPGE